MVCEIFPWAVTESYEQDPASKENISRLNPRNQGRRQRRPRRRADATSDRPATDDSGGMMPNFSAERGVDEQGVKDDLYLASKEPISCDHCSGHGAFPPVFRPPVARATLYRSGVAIRVLERAAWWTARGTRDNIRLPDLESLIRRSGEKMGELKRLRRSVGAWRRIRLVALTRQSQPGAAGMGIKPLYAGTARTRHRPLGAWHGVWRAIGVRSLWENMGAGRGDSPPCR